MEHEQQTLISNDSEGTTSSHDDTDSRYGQFTTNESASYRSGSSETVEIDKPDDILQKERPYIYQQDVVRCNKTGNVGFVSEVACDSDSESDITDDEDDDEDSKEKVGEEGDKENAVHGEGNTNNSVDEKKNADSFKFGALQADQVRVVWMDCTEPIQYIKDVTVVDRGFSLGDFVASASDATGQVGVVVNVNIAVDLLSPDGSVVKDISTRELKRVRDFAVGDYVVHGSWLGRIDNVADNVTVSFDDGSMCKVVNAEPSRLRPSPGNTLGEDVHFPYYPGQHVKASSSSVFKYSWWLSGSWKPRRLEGTVTKVTAGSLYVFWIAFTGSGQGSSVAPSEQQNPKNLKLLSWFAYANWQVGDRCLLPSVTQSSSIPLHKQRLYESGLHDSAKIEEGHQVECGFDSEDIEESNENSESTELGPEPSLNGKKGTITKRASASPSVSKEPAHNSWPLHRKKIRKVVIRKDKKIRNKEESYDRALLIVNSKTMVDVLWQDGTVERDRKAITLIPIESPADHEFFSEQYVVERASDDASDATGPKRVGIVKSVDAKERTACVRWLKQVSRAEDPREFDKEEIVSVYELEDHPDYDYCYGDVVVRLSPVFVAEQTSLTETFLEESTQEEYTKKNVTKHSGSEKVDLSWVGHITGLKDGNIEVTWADGIVSTVDPTAIYVIGRDDDDPVVAIGGEVSDDAASWVTVDDEEDEMDAPEKAEEEQGGENSTEVKSDAENHSGSNGASALPLAANGVENEDQFQGSLKALEERNFVDDKLCSVIGDSENMKRKDGDHPSAEISTLLESDAAEELCSIRIEKSDDHDDNCGFKSFDISQDPLDHHFLGEDSQASKGRKWFKKVQQDWQILQNNLPDGIYVRVYEDRMDLVRAAILGAYGTPYQDGLFFFDFHLPPEYPDVPPSTYYHSGGWKINPNLYEEGKVCLSLLNTWTGKGNEVWDRKSSSILQVLVSLQGLVLNSKPYFNEAGYDKQIGTAEGEKNSLAYNENSFLLNCKMMMYLMRKPPKGFEELIEEHFKRHGYYILKACDAYMKGYLIGSLAKDATASYELKANSTSVGFKLMLAKIFPKLFSALSEIGAECEEFKHLLQESH